MKLKKGWFFCLSLAGVLGAGYLAYDFRYQLLNSSSRKQWLISLLQPNFPKPSAPLNDHEVKELIIKERPILTQDISDLEKVNALREWVYYNVPISDHNLLIDTLSTIHTHAIPLGTRIQIFREGLAGAWCGGAAEVLREVYELFGFEAYNVDQGDPQSKGTHIFNLVKINYRGEDIYIVEDAYTNYFISDTENNPMSYFTFLSLIKERNHKKIKIQWGSLHGESHKFRLVKKEDTTEKAFKTFSNGNRIDLISFPASSMLVDRCMPKLIQDHYPPHVLYISAYPFKIVGKNRKKSKLLLYTAQNITQFKTKRL